MNLECRALYNSLRMNWLNDSNVAVEPWQVEDYRSMPLETLFERLKLQDIYFDKSSFLTLADQFDTPEDMTEDLLADADVDAVTHDQVYLLVFELWRRLIPEKPCLSVFCDELDHQIYLYDSGKLSNPESIQDILANLEVVLDENADEGIDPVDVFESICSNCANDVENFLYDFIAEQIENHNIFYASELLDGFGEYFSDVKWFDFLRTKLMFSSEPENIQPFISQLIQDYASEHDLEFNLEVLGFLVLAGDKDDFVLLVKETIPLLECEEDFQDMLVICADFFHRLDLDEKEADIQSILQTRSKMPLEALFNRKDPVIERLFSVMK